MGKTNEIKKPDLIEQLLDENRTLREELKQLKEQLDNELFAKAKAISKVGYWSYSYAENKIVYSDEVYSIFEVPKSTDLSNYKQILSFFHPSDREEFIDTWKEREQNENHFVINSRIVVPDGSLKFVTFSILIDRDKNKQPIALSGTITDNSESIIQVESTKRNEELFRNLFNNLTDIFILFEVKKDAGNQITDYLFRDVNSMFEMKFNIRKDKITDTGLSLHPSLFQQFNALFKLTALTQQPQQDRLFIQPLDSFFDVLIYSPAEDLIATLWRDVSLIVETESALRESEEKYRQIFSIGNDALFMVDFLSGKILDVNPVASKLFGYSKDQLQKLPFRNLSISSDVFEKQIIEQKSNLINQIFKRADGSEFPAEVSLSYFNWGGRRVLVASLRDISERIHAQEELVKSEKKFKHLFHYSNDAILIIQNYRIIDFNQKACSLFRVKEEELNNKTLWNLSPPKQPGGDDSRSKAVEYIQNSLLGDPLQFEWVFQRSDRKTFYADLKFAPIIYGNEKVIQGIVRDISPQKESQQVLKTSVERWKAALEYSSIGVWDWNIPTNEVYFSSVWKKMLGYEKEDIGNSFEDFEKRLHPADLTYVYNTIDEYLTAKSPDFTLVYRLRCKNGTYKWIQSQGKIYSYDVHGKPEHFIGTNLDITRQKITEENLFNEKNNLKLITDLAQLGFWELNIRTMVITGSLKTYELFGFKNSSQVSLRQMEQLIHPDDRKYFISQFVTSGIPTEKEQSFRIHLPNETKYIFSHSLPVFDHTNILTGYKGFFLDVTRFKEQELQIRNEQALLKSFTEKIEHSILIVLNDAVIYANNKYSELTGYTQKEIINQSITPFHIAVPEDRIVLKKIQDSLGKNPSFSEKTDIRIETKNNRIKWAEMSVTSVEIMNERGILYELVEITHRKLREIELSLIEKQNKAIIAHSPIGYALMNDRGQIFFNNKAFYLMTGVDSNGIKIKSYETFLDSDFSNEISKGIELITFKISPVYIHDFCSSNEKKTWYRISISPQIDASSAIEFYIITLEDIDEQKRSAFKTGQELSHKMFMLEYSGIGLGLLNKQMELLEGNQILFDLFDRYNQTDDKHFFTNLPFFNDTLAPRLSSEVPVPFQQEIEFPADKQIRIGMFPVHSNDTNAQWVIVASDISSLKKEQEKLLERLERFEKIVEKAPTGIALVDKNRNILYHNAQYAEILGYAPQELVLHKLDELVTLDSLDETLSLFAHLFTGLTSRYSQNVQMSTRDRGKRCMHALIAPYPDPFGNPKYGIQFLTDISELKEEQKKEKNRVQLRTLEHISQDYAKRLLDWILLAQGQAILLKNTLPEPYGTQNIEPQIHSLVQASNLTTNILSFLPNANIIMVLQPVHELLSSIVDQLLLPEGYNVQYIPSSQKEKINADAVLLRQAIHHIIQNAVEAMPQKGTISLLCSTVYFDAPGTKNNSEFSRGSYLRLSISDMGIGIAPELQNAIFDPFFTTKEKDRHTGLGLTIARQVIQAHNGILKVISQPNQGTSINIYLPLPGPEKYDARIQPDELYIQKGTPNVLVMDDDKIVRTITAEILNDMGYDVYCFENGKRALAFYRENASAIDYLFIDQSIVRLMPNDGIRQLKTLQPGSRIILLSDPSMTKADQESDLEVFSHIIEKPVSATKLHRAIASIQKLENNDQ